MVWMIGHEFDVPGDVLTDLIDKEIQAKILFDFPGLDCRSMIGMDLFGESLGWRRGIGLRYLSSIPMLPMRFVATPVA